MMETSFQLILYRLYSIIKILIGSWFIFFTSCTDKQDPNPQENYYFPPINSTTWEAIAYQSLDWDGKALEELINWLPTQDTRAFIILIDGRIVVEEYWGENLTRIGSMDQNSFWYWASAGKTLTSAMIGIAQERNYLSINDKTQKFLGKGWTSLSEEQEGDITVFHQLSMTTGLDDDVFNPDDVSASSLNYKAKAGERWAYHNAPYTLLEKVIENASGTDYQTFFKANLGDKIGMNGFWQKTGDNNVFYSDARSMARFGLLLLAKGDWAGEKIWSSSYFEDMHETSQQLNKSYGLLTWLNGKESFMIPQSQQVFGGSLVSVAPPDMYQAMGKNGQFLMVIPSENMVVVRMGDSPGDLQVPFLLIREIWDRLFPVLY